jgi:hypothetical protein
VRITRAHFDILGSSQAEAVKVENEALDFELNGIARSCRRRKISPALSPLICQGDGAYLSGLKRSLQGRLREDALEQSIPYRTWHADFRQQTVT